MDNILKYLDQILFVVLPYVAMTIFLLVTIQRYRSKAFTYSSLSSQFLENKHHFWAMVPFHYGIIILLLGHIIGFLVPRQVLLWNSHPLRLYILEISALAFGLLTLVGLIMVVIRRSTDVKCKIVTSPTDWILYVFLGVQVFSGVYIALFHGWGTSWFAAVAAPYLWSLLKLNPQISSIAVMPLMVKVHIVNAFLTIGFFPFTRLVHILVAPNPYLWRRTQVVRWYWDRKSIRNPKI